MNISTVPVAHVIDLPPAPDSRSVGDLRGVVVRVGGEVDIYTAPTLLQALQDALTASTVRPGGGPTADVRPGAEGESQVTALVVDLTQVDFIDSSAIGVLVQGHHLARRSGCGYALVATHPMIHALFGVTGLAKVLPLHPDVITAVAYLRPVARPSCT